MEYTTHFDADMDLEQKLSQCGHKPSRIQDAKQVMEMFIKKLKNYACYPISAEHNPAPDGAYQE